jgi:hypothetical protein
MGLVMPAGVHRVTVRFSDRSVGLGLLVSLIGLAVLATAWVRAAWAGSGRTAE